jgi:hypothetical protein
MTELAETLKQRNSVYGDFSDNAEVSVTLKETLRIAWNKRQAATEKKIEDYAIEALDLIATKLSHIVTGDPSYIDNWHDIAGYAKLVEERLTAAKELAGSASAPGTSGGFAPYNKEASDRLIRAISGASHPSECQALGKAEDTINRADTDGPNYEQGCVP